MKVLKFLFLGLGLVILIAVIALVVFITTFDINQYKSRLTQAISSVVGRQVDVRELKLGFTMDKGLTFIARGLSIADDSAFFREAFLTVDSVYLNADISKFVLDREISISKIEIRNPNVRVIRNAQGLFNAQTMIAQQGAQPISAANPPMSSPSTITPSRPQAKASTVMPMMVHAISIIDGSLTYLDQSSQPVLTVPLKRISLKITDISLTKKFPFHLDAMLWADEPNIHAQGEIAIDVRDNRARFEQTRFETDLSQIHLREMPFYSFLKEKILLEGDLKGKIILDGMQFILGRDGMRVQSLHGTLTGGQANFEFLGKPLEDIHVDLQMNEAGIDLKEVGFSYASGVVNGHGRLSDYGKSNMFLLDCHADDVQVAELFPKGKMPVLEADQGPLHLEGRMYADFNVEGEGAQLEQLQKNLKGDGSLEIREAKLANINLLRFVLDKISFLPGLVQRVEENLPPEHKEKLTSPETVFDQVVLKADIHDQTAILTADVGADVFSMKANGRLGFDQNVTLTADFYIPEGLSGGMAAAVEELGYFRDQEGKIHIPLKAYEGKWQEARIYPDIGRLSKLVIRNKGQEELRKAIFKVLNVEDVPQTPPETEENKEPPGEPTQPDTETTAPRLEQMILEGILDTIFKGKRGE